MTGPTPLSDDLKELLGLFRFHHVDFLVAEVPALAVFGKPRFTENLRLFLRRTSENAQRARSALTEFGLELSDEAEGELAENPRAMVVLGRKPSQVDLLTFLDGVEFGEAWQRRVPGHLGDSDVFFVSLEDFVATKRASGRPRDLDDIARLRESLGRPLPGDC